MIESTNCFCHDDDDDDDDESVLFMVLSRDSNKQPIETLSSVVVSVCWWLLKLVCWQ